MFTPEPNKKRLVAEWASKKKKYWIILFCDNIGYSYKSDSGGGFFSNDWALNDKEAIAKMETTVLIYGPRMYMSRIV